MTYRCLHCGQGPRDCFHGIGRAINHDIPQRDGSPAPSDPPTLTAREFGFPSGVYVDWREGTLEDPGHGVLIAGPDDRVPRSRALALGLISPADVGPRWGR